MDPISFSGLATPLQILLVDLLLGADNALLIGMASRALPPRERGRAAALGIGGAVLLRLAMTTVAASALAWPLVKLAGAAVLMLIALSLAQEEESEAEGLEGGARFWKVAFLIVVADAVMSLDNVVALAAIAQGNFLWLLVGVGLSLPLLGYGGLAVAETLHEWPGLMTLGAALLGWIAGGMAVSDAIWARGLEANAPALVAFAPALGAAFVYLHLRFVPRPRKAPAPRPLVSLHPVAALPPPPPPRPPEPATATPVEADGRLVLAGMLLLALIAGGFLVAVTYYGGLE